MIEFTKEELIYLFNCVDSDIECFDEPDIAYVVRDKIKASIEQEDRYKKAKDYFNEIRGKNER